MTRYLLPREFRGNGARTARSTTLNLVTLEDRSVPATISGTVYNDLNANLALNAGEPGFNGVTVYLDSNNNNVLDVAVATYNSTNVPIAIPAQSATPNLSTLVITDTGTLSDVNVTINITHTYDGDMSIFLVSPTGIRVELSTFNGGSGDNYTNTIFDDEVVPSVIGSAAPFSGSFRPESALSALDGKALNGTWTLEVLDNVAGDSGTINSWSITATKGSEPSQITPAAGTYSFTGLPAGSYVVRQLAPPPGGFSLTSPGGDGAYRPTLTAAGTFVGNFGNSIPPASFTGIAYADANGNKAKDVGEAVLANVTVFLDANQNGVINAGEASTTTNGSGVYTFNNVVPNQNYFVAALAPPGGTQTTPIRNGLNVLPPVNITKSAGDDNETTVAIDPTNPVRLFSANNSEMVGFSTNGGNTWTNRTFPSGGDSALAACCDFNSAWDKFGNLWIVYLTSSITTALARSTDGGQSFTLIQDFGSSDHPSIAVGPSATAGQQTLAFQDNASGGCRVVMAQINAAGVVGGIMNVGITPDSNTGISGNFGDIVIGPLGQVAVTYVNAGSGQGPDANYFNIDPDGTGPQPFGARSTITATNIGGFDFLPAQPSRSVDSEPDLVWDTTGGPNNGRLYLAYTDEIVDEGHDSEIFIRYSDNAGTTWSPRIRVNDDATTNSQFLQRIAMDNTNGNLAVSFYDARDSGTNTKVHYYGTASFDGGLTWATNAKLSTGQSDETGGSGFDFGDYNDIDFVAGRFVTTWGDNSNSTGDNPNGTAAQDVYLGRVDVANNVKNHSVPAAVPGKSYTGLDFGFSGVAAPAAAKVSGIEINAGAVQRSNVTSLKVSFDQIVTAPTNAFTLARQGGGGTVTLAGVLDNTAGFTTVTFSFTGSAVQNKSLIDGRYTLTIDDALVSNANGLFDGDGNGSPGGDYVLVGNPGTNKLHRLFGDGDGSGNIDGTDFGLFGTAVGASSGPGVATFDFDGNNFIDGTDLGEFGGRFGLTI